MPLRCESLEEPQLNLTAMLDVVFNLIIFFMVGTQFADMERQIDVHLPVVSDAQPLTAPPDEIIVNVQSNGKITIANETFTLPQLREKLKQAHQNYAGQAVLVRGDGASAFQQIMDVLAACHDSQITNFSLAALVKEEGSP